MPWLASTIIRVALLNDMLFNIRQICLSYESGLSQCPRSHKHAKYTDVADELAEILLRSNKAKSPHALLDIFANRKAKSFLPASWNSQLHHDFEISSRNRATKNRLSRASMHFLWSWRAVVNFSSIKRASIIILRWSIQFARNISLAGDFREAKPPRYLHQSFKATEMERNLRWARITVIFLLACVIYISRDFIFWIVALFDIYLSSQYFS